MKYNESISKLIIVSGGGLGFIMAYLGAFQAGYSLVTCLVYAAGGCLIGAFLFRSISRYVETCVADINRREAEERKKERLRRQKEEDEAADGDDEEEGEDENEEEKGGSKPQAKEKTPKASS